MMNFNFLKNQLASVIEWTNQQASVLLYKFPSEHDEIKNAGKLIVGPGQGVLLVYEGKITDVLTENGIYELETDNHPFITTLLKLRTAFESEHKLKIYFFRLSDVPDQNWGTAAAIKYTDPVYKFPVELGANGNFSYRVADPKLFFAEKVGLVDLYATTTAKILIQSRIAQTLATQLAASQFSYAQIDTQLSSIATGLKELLSPDLEKLGLELLDIRISGTVFDKGTQDRINSISNIIAESQAAETGGMNFVELEKLRALRDAARNQGGLSGAGMQLAAGLALSKTFNLQGDEHTTTDDPMIKLQKLKTLLDGGIITQEEFDEKKREWLRML